MRNRDLQSERRDKRLYVGQPELSAVHPGAHGTYNPRHWGEHLHAGIAEHLRSNKWSDGANTVSGGVL